MRRGVSLANKCLLWFGGGLVLVVLAALTVPWFRMDGLVSQWQLEISRQLVERWERMDAAQSTPGVFTDPGAEGWIEYGGIRAKRLRIEEAQARAGSDPFLARAVERLRSSRSLAEHQSTSWVGSSREYRYAKALRDAGEGENAGALRAVVILEPRRFKVTWLLAVNTVYLVSAGAVVWAFAVAVFYVILHKVILNPVRALKLTAEKVRAGNMEVRSSITTGDEFEQLAGTFNGMLEELQRSHDQMRAVNRALDVKLNELAEANSALYETARIKGDFLASVSHELRTPLNSIIGFAELMREQAQAEADAGDDSTRLAKRIRYLEHIASASRGLLDLINSLLEMARIEAGRVEVHPAPMAVRDTCEGLLGLAYPLAQRKGIELKLEAGDDIPTVETDVKKFQQIIFNFLSNAVKFTPGLDRDGKAGRVTLRAELIHGRGPDGDASEDRVRVSVIDTGPGIAPADQGKLFQKFSQLETGHTREHTGTGLGLAISKELATLLQAEIQLVSDEGRGSMFSLILPLRFDKSRAQEQILESGFRGALSPAKAWVAQAG